MFYGRALFSISVDHLKKDTYYALILGIMVSFVT